jgi:predicted HTH transcriptional regulator
LTYLTNAKRRKMEQELAAWKSKFNGLKWENAIRDHAEAKRIERAINANMADLEKFKDLSSTVESKIAVLKSLGFIKQDGTLTTLGILATELNECDSLLISQFYLMP